LDACLEQPENIKDATVSTPKKGRKSFLMWKWFKFLGIKNA
jgi:hypothetical protein